MRVACPECAAPLRLSDDLPAGKNVKCPKCQNLFAVPKPSSAAVSPTPPRNRPTVDRDDDEPRERRRPERRFKPKKQQGTGVLPALIIGGLALLLVAGGVGAGIYFLTRDSKTTVAKAPEATQPSRPAPGPRENP